MRDADAQVFGGLYVHSLLLGGGTEQIGTISARGLNIYYDPVAPGNEYLGARTYRLAGGGAVIPVPEPACPLLLLAAAAIAASARRRSVGKRV